MFAGSSGGKFEFDPVLPGAYLLQATLQFGAPFSVVSQIMTAGSGDVEDLQLRLRPAPEISGKVTPEAAGRLPSDVNFGFYETGRRYLGGQDVTTTPFDLTSSAGAHLDILFSPNADRIEGSPR